MRRVLALAAFGLLVLPALPAPSLAEPAPSAHPSVVEPFALTVDAQLATGWLAYPTDAAPTTLLVFAHGCCGSLGDGNFLAGYAATYGAAAVAMSYRGNGHWNVWTGHRDTIAATEALQRRWPIQRTVIWGVSMGGEVSGMAVAARPDLYDDWVDTFGVTDLFQEFAALGLYPGIAANPGNPANPVGSWILEETGGLPGVAPPEAWVLRSPDLRAAEMVGLQRAYIAHGVGDLIVYPTESLATLAALQRQGIPASLCLTLTRPGPLVTHFVPGLGVPSAPTPIGLSAHDGYGFGCTGTWIDQLLRGLEPDAGTLATLTVYDYNAGAGQVVQVPSLP
ncbi:MAG TPA: prolyl oligopeptidase family serine peptidase [Candidatus Thermoplasmatota archaeon]|jgi:pimeloyl-ACP methyl ester carboxylesterase|nr:prolyl oligopeptidase family serine peptidase [Candidatus Thermoplasmatota archaeon]